MTDSEPRLAIFLALFEHVWLISEVAHGYTIQQGGVLRGAG